MTVFPDKIEEYIRRHNPIWRDMEVMLKMNGVRNYSIFLDEKNHDLIGYAEVESAGHWEGIAQTEICKKWWDSMSELMETNSDNSPVSVDLREIFHLE